VKRPVCSRAWEAEAIEDGRLDGRTRASFERHSAICDVCTRERTTWKRLSVIVARIPKPPAPSELQRKRGRIALLRDAHRSTLADPWPWTRWSMALAALAVVVFAAGWGYRRSRLEPRGSSATLAQRLLEVEPNGPADWSVDDDLAPTRMALREGTVSLHVAKLQGGQRFVVGMPDGEIEVRGTRFVVVVNDARTRSVDVSEGTVALRLVGQAEKTLHAGERWSLIEPPAPADSTEPTPLPYSPPAEPAIALGSRSAHPKAQPSGLLTPGALFAAAMSAYETGAFERAEELLGEFTNRFPKDARCEDAALVGVIIRNKRGDRAGARQLAHQYLARYPGGLHEAEVERFLH